jgi:RNA polymerase sigma-70 factor (ECF subfamily)
LRELSGDALARATLRANAGRILDYLARRVDDPEDAADLFGDAYLVAWRKRRSMPADEESARKWLYVVARNTLLNHYRSKKRRRALTESLRREMTRALDVAPPDDEAVEIREAIASLPPAQAELVRLVHWDGLSLVDAAEVMGVGASTARSRYATAKENLRRALAVTAR